MNLQVGNYKHDKKKLISIIFLLFTFQVYGVENNKEVPFVFFNSVTWAIQQQEADLSETGQSAADFAIGQFTEEHKNVSIFINRNFVHRLTVSGAFNVFDFPDPLGMDADGAGAEQARKVYRYSISPKITEFNIIESETSGLFLKISIIFTFEDNRDNNARDFSISAIGWGQSKSAVITDALNKIVNQFEYVIIEFEELTDRFRVLDVFQGTVVINAGRNRGIKKGDFFYSYDYNTGKRTGNFVIERREENLAFARVLNTKVEPETADLLKGYNYIGILSKTYVNYFSGNTFSGYLAGTRVLWTRGLYSVNPALGIDIYDLADFNDNKLTLMSPYIGLRIVRYIKSFSLSSTFSLNRGYVSSSDIEGVAPGWEYYGGTAKAEIEKRIMKHFSIHIEGGYTGFFSPDHENYPEISGFIFGAGIGLKF